MLHWPENNEVLWDETEENKGEKKDAIGMCIRSTSDISRKGEDIRSSYIPPNWNDMRSIADITELSDILLGVFNIYICLYRLIYNNRCESL
jgi:hypothetical protein